LLTYEIEGEDERARYAAATSVPASRGLRSGIVPAISGWTASSPKPSTRLSLERRIIMNLPLLIMVGLLLVVAMGGAAFAFVGASGDKTKKRMASVAKPTASARAVKGASDTNQQRRKNVQAMLKELEKQQAHKKKRPTLRRRIEQAGLSISIRTFWVLSGVAGCVWRRGRVPDRESPLCRASRRLRSGLRPAALGACLPQGAPRERPLP